MTPMPSDSHASQAPHEEEPLEDRSLVAFLHTHQPIAPPAASELEEQLLNAIQLEPVFSQKSVRSHHRLWAWAGAMGTLMVLAVSGRHWQHQPQLVEQDRPPELAQLQTFIEQSWDGVYVHQNDSLDPSLDGLDWLPTNSPE